MSDLSAILVVDDDPIQLEILDSYFKSSGVETVLKAANGISALRQIDENAELIDLVLCDLKMPELDGIEFMRHLKDSPYDGPVAIFSSADRFLIESAEKLAQIHGLNLIGSIRKPVNRVKLDGLVSKMGHQSRLGTARSTASFDEPALKEAIEKGHIQPYYQPKTAVKSQTIVGAEVLARWIHPELGIISPHIFMPLAERAGLMRPLTQCIVAAAIEDLRRWRSDDINIKMAVNVTAEILENVDFPGWLLDRMQDAGLGKSRLILEVTEAGVLEANAATMEVLTRLRIKDIDISIDDFGTGFSNIEQLRKFPYSELKIDRAFISDGPDDSFADASVRACITLGRELNMRIVAEGVATRRQWDYAKNRGVDMVQGFFIAQPMAAADFRNFYLQCDGKIDIGETEVSPVDLYAPLTEKGAA